MREPPQQPAALRLAQPRALRPAARSIRVHHLGLRQLHLALPHRTVAGDVAVLADAGRVVHQAGHQHPRMVGDRVERLRHVVRRQLAAEVEEMLRLQQPGIAQRIQVAHAVEEGLAAPGIEAEIAEAERIQHRGHAGRGALRVMRQHRRPARPAGIGARQHLAFQVVGMHVDHAGDQVVAVEVLGRGSDGCGRAAPRRSGRRG